MRRALYAWLLALFLLHNDWWLWGDDRRIAGVPVGLAYHVAYCLVVIATMALLVRHAWPPDLEGDD